MAASRFVTMRHQRVDKWEPRVGVLLTCTVGSLKVALVLHSHGAYCALRSGIQHSLFRIAIRGSSHDLTVQSNTLSDVSRASQQHNGHGPGHGNLSDSTLISARCAAC